MLFYLLKIISSKYYLIYSHIYFYFLIYLIFYLQLFCNKYKLIILWEKVLPDK